MQMGYRHGVIVNTRSFHPVVVRKALSFLLKVSIYNILALKGNENRIASFIRFISAVIERSGWLKLPLYLSFYEHIGAIDSGQPANIYE
jgi:hypothetical protein